MPEEPAERTGAADAGRRSGDPLQVVGVGIASGLLFAVGLLVTEAPGELALDVDLKPFFLPYLVIAAFRYGMPTLSAGLGAAIGEGVLDLVEGYELDDPIGFVGYAVGFTVFGWYLHRVASDPGSRRVQVVAAVLGAFAQAAFEGLAFLVFAADASPTAALVSVAGNTVTHGVLLGAIPLVLCYPLVGRYLGGEKIEVGAGD
jgi:hypothetical protein